MERSQHHNEALTEDEQRHLVGKMFNRVFETEEALRDGTHPRQGEIELYEHPESGDPMAVVFEPRPDVDLDTFRQDVIETWGIDPVNPPLPPEHPHQ